MILVAAVLVGVAALAAARPLSASWGRARAWYVGALERRAAELGEPAAVWLGPWVAAAVGAALAGAALVPLLAPPLGLLVVLVPRWRLAARVAARERLVRDAFGEAVAAITAAVRSGQPLATALLSTARDAPAPAAAFLRRAARDLAGGLSTADALRPLRDRLRLAPVTLFVTTVLVCERHGGRMADALDNVAEAVRDRQRLERLRDVQTASGRHQLRILAAVPALFLLLTALLFPDGARPLVGTLAGQAVLLGVGGLVAAGVWLGRRIVNRF